MFEDNFSNIVPEGGAFLTRYSRWGAYPNYFPVTNKRGFYKPNLLSVKDLGNGQTALAAVLCRAPSTAMGSRGALRRAHAFRARTTASTSVSAGSSDAAL